MKQLQFDSFRLNSDNNRTTDKVTGHSKYDIANPKTSRQTEKSDEYKPSKTKKTGRSESSSNLHREKSKNTEYDAYPDDRMSNLKMMANNDMIEQSRFGSERLLMDESQRRMLDKVNFWSVKRCSNIVIRRGRVVRLEVNIERLLMCYQALAIAIKFQSHQDLARDMKDNHIALLNITSTKRSLKPM